MTEAVINLTSDSGSIDLPAVLVWIDRYNWTPITQTVTRLLDGGNLIEEGLISEEVGRPFTLESMNKYGRMQKSLIESLVAWLIPGISITLTFPDSRGIHTVTWLHGAGSTSGQSSTSAPIQATPIRLPPDIDGQGDWYDVSLKFIGI